MRALVAAGTLLWLAACSSMPLTSDARKLRIVQKKGKNVELVYKIKKECRLLGEDANDDRNELFNDAASKGADTVIVEEGGMFRPDHAAQFYQCSTGSGAPKGTP